MTVERETARIVRSWLEEGRTALPDHVLDTVLDQLPTTRQRRPLWPARRVGSMTTVTRIGLVAAVVLVAVVVGWRLLPASNTGRPPSPSPAPTGRLVASEGPLATGTWAFHVESIHVTFDIPAQGWQKNVIPNAIWTENSGGRVTFDVVENLYVDPCDPTDLRDPAIGPTVDDLATTLANLPGIEATGPTDASLGGYAGKLVEISIPASEEPCAGAGASLWPIAAIAEPAPLDAGRSRFWIVDVEGTRLVVGAVERDNLATVLRNELQEIVDSIVLTPR